MNENPEIRDRLNVNKSTYHNKRPRERFICFIRGAKWMKINQLNGPSPIHDTSTWLNQSIQSIRHVCCRLGTQKNLPWKCFRTAFDHYDLLSTSKLHHLLLQGPLLRCIPEGFNSSHAQELNPWSLHVHLSGCSQNRVSVSTHSAVARYPSLWVPCGGENRQRGWSVLRFNISVCISCISCLV